MSKLSVATLKAWMQQLLINMSSRKQFKCANVTLFLPFLILTGEDEEPVIYNLQINYFYGSLYSSCHFTLNLDYYPRNGYVH